MVIVFLVGGWTVTVGAPSFQLMTVVHGPKQAGCAGASRRNVCGFPGSGLYQGQGGVRNWLEDKPKKLPNASSGGGIVIVIKRPMRRGETKGVGDPHLYLRRVPKGHSSGPCHQWEAGHVGVTGGRSDTGGMMWEVIADDLVIILNPAPEYLSPRSLPTSMFFSLCTCM